MDSFINNVVRSALYHYENATPTDFGSLALAIVLVSWFCTRFYGER
jgi:hypothetical protein